jgi:hypothetical protein
MLQGFIKKLRAAFPNGFSAPNAGGALQYADFQVGIMVVMCMCVCVGGRLEGVLSRILISRLVIPAKSASHVICRSVDQEKMCMPLPAMILPGNHPPAHKTMLTCVQEMLSELGQEGLQTLLEGGLVFSDLEGALASLPVGFASLTHPPTSSHFLLTSSFP